MTGVFANRSKIAAGILLAGTIACSDYPRDVENTTARLEQGAPLEVGVVSGTVLSPAAQTALSRIAATVGASLERSEAPAAILLDRLDKGETALVIGEFAKNTPLAKSASFSQPIDAPEPDDGSQPVLRLVRRNGENRWILLTDRVVGQ